MAICKTKIKSLKKYRNPNWSETYNAKINLMLHNSKHYFISPVLIPHPHPRILCSEQHHAPFVAQQTSAQIKFKRRNTKSPNVIS